MALFTEAGLRGLELLGLGLRVLGLRNLGVHGLEVYLTFFLGLSLLSESTVSSSTVLETDNKLSLLLAYRMSVVELLTQLSACFSSSKG